MSNYSIGASPSCIAVFSFVLFALFCAQANAGASEGRRVTIGFLGSGDGRTVAAGHMGFVRATDNNMEYIGCEVRYLRRTNDDVTVIGNCRARNSEGRNVGCTTSNAVLIRAIESITSYAALRFVMRSDGAACEEISVTKRSSFLPPAGNDIAPDPQAVPNPPSGLSIQ